MRLRLLVAVTVCSAGGLVAQKKPLDVETLLKIQRIGEPALSPDGKLVAFSVQTPDLEKNTRPSQIYVVPIDGGTPRQLTREGANNQRPRWSPDSKRIYFISDRAGASPNGTAQVWAMDANGANLRQITKLSTEAGGILISPDGKTIVFESSVYPECDTPSGAF